MCNFNNIDFYEYSNNYYLNNYINNNFVKNGGSNENNNDFWNIGIFDPEGINLNPFNKKPYSDSYKNLAKFWSNLPTYKQAKEITQSIISNEVILIISGCGSGKSVIVPKLSIHSLNYKGKVIMTLPKKIITKKAAEFAAKTLDVELGEQVGYQFRGENMKSDNTLLLYSTDGSIISQIKSDPMLKQYQIVIIDEAHERKVQIDLLLYLLKNAIKLRKEKNLKPLKLIIMSATINEKIFRTYYSDFKFDSIELAGTPNYPIKSIYLESGLNIKSNQYLESGCEIIEQIIKNINSEVKEYEQGDILFFVCTISECDDIAEKLGKKFPDSFTMGLYSGFDPELERYISSPTEYKELNSQFKRRIFVSTNVAESSLTIDGIVYVIDSGLELSVNFDPTTNTNVMTKNFITQAQMTQRKGRAGRTKPGICYHLYTPQEQESCPTYPYPEIKRIDIKNTCLSLLKMCGDIDYGSDSKNSSESESENESKKINYNTKNNTNTKTKSKSNSTNKSCTTEQAINMFTHFIEPPGEKFISNGFEFAYSNQLIGKENKLTRLGRLVLETRLDLMDGLALLYAWNISSTVFKAVFKIISICSYLKSGILDLFNEDVDSNTKNNLIKKLISGSDKSEHVFLYRLNKYIESNKDLGIFQLELFDSIQQAYTRQIDKLTRIYDRFNYVINEIKKNDLNSNIINSFGFGYKTNRAKRSGSNYGYKYNGIPTDMSKCLFKYDSDNKYIIFYSNLYWSGKLNLMICSPYLLD